VHARGAQENAELALTEPLMLEMRYSARDGSDFALLAEELDALPLLALDSHAIKRALQAQRASHFLCKCLT